ncbi:Protein of unknown function [Bacillus cereus]|nr:Protein of unknown function [Bacillus cereus]
MNDTREDEH